MKAAILRDFNNLCIEEVPQPKASEPGTVVVQIKSCGICATDYKAIKGIRKNVTFPFIPGHETSGIIVEIGPNVIHFKVGDEVICQPTGYCGFCKYCRSGNPHYCENAFTTGGDGPKDVWPGAFAEYMLTKEQCLFQKPKNISFNAAALTEPLSGAWKGLIQYSEMKIGNDVVIIGVGGIGLLCLMVAKAAGAGRLIAVDISNFGRKNALKLGATHAIDPSNGKAKGQIYEIIPDGPDIVVESAGSIDAVKQMISILRRGTHWNLFGITTHETFELDGGITHFLEARMDASFGTTPLAMEHAIKLMETGLINTEQIISHCFTLDKIHEAIEVMENQGHNKIIINP